MTPRTAADLLPSDPAAAGCGADATIALPGRGEVPVRIYGRGQRTAGGGTPLVLHFHGGAFVSGCLESGALVPRLLEGAGAVTVSLAYPLAPAHPFPEGIETGFAALEWLYKQRTKLVGKGARIFLAGEEAGGNLAAAVALVARDRAHPPLAGQLLLSPMLDPCAGTASLREASCAEMTASCRWAEGWQKYLHRPMDALHPYAVPGSSLRLADIAPTLVLVGQDDPMRDEALAYAKRLGDAGIPVTSQVLPGASNWPEALYEPDSNACAACEQSVEEHFRAFFQAATPPPH